jgi:DNA-binding NarL/FixJ family response regulator
VCSGVTTWAQIVQWGAGSDELWEVVPLSILIADDHVIIRRGLRNLLKDHLSVRFMEEAGSIAELMRALKGATPDLLVLDLQLGDGHALDVLEQIRCSHPEMRVLVYTMSP